MTVQCSVREIQNINILRVSVFSVHRTAVQATTYNYKIDKYNSRPIKRYHLSLTGAGISNFNFQRFSSERGQGTRTESLRNISQ